MSTVLSYAQTDTLWNENGIQLPLVSVKGTKEKQDETIPYKAPTPRALAEILTQMNVLPVKAYGLGGLSTITLQGHSTSQTNLILDGFNLRSVTTGAYDLSLIPSFFLSEVRVNTNSGSAEVNGNIGGALTMNTDIPLTEKLNIESVSSYGSFDTWGQYLSVGGKWKTHASTLKVFWRQSDNDFKYRNINVIGKPFVKQENGEYHQYGIQQNNRFVFGKHSFKTKFWYLNNHRQIPPVQTAVADGTFQDDWLLNSIVSWKAFWTDRFQTKLSGRYSYERIYYDSPITQADTKSNKLEFRGQANYRIHPEHYVSTTLGNEYFNAITANYDADKPTQNRTYAQLKYEWKRKRFQADVAIKEDKVGEDWSPLLVGTNLKYQWAIHPEHSLHFKLSVSKNYRRPDFNDLYWKNTGFAKGNPNLKPEESWKEELRLSYQFRKNYQFSIAGFNSNVDRWILWYPDNTGAWTPSNVKVVWSRGLEVGARAIVPIGQAHKLVFRSTYNYTRTTNQDTKGDPTELGKQLLYVPLHSADFSAEWHYNKWYAYFNTLLNGKRYYTLDNGQSVPTYMLGNLMLGRRMNFGDLEVEPTLEIRNIWNEEYHVVANRQMPLAHYQMTVYVRWLQ